MFEVIIELARGHDSSDEQIKQSILPIFQNCSCFHIAKKYGLRWSIHTKELADSNVDEVVNRCDDSIGLRLFTV